jgi:hypothetical protein
MSGQAEVWTSWLVVAKFIIAQEGHAIFGLGLREYHPEPVWSDEELGHLTREWVSAWRRKDFVHGPMASLWMTGKICV